MASRNLIFIYFFYKRYIIILLFIFIYKTHRRRHLGGTPTALFMHTSWQYVLKYCRDRAPFFNFSHRLADRTKFDRTKKKYSIDEVMRLSGAESAFIFTHVTHVIPSAVLRKWEIRKPITDIYLVYWPKEITKTNKKNFDNKQNKKTN